MICKMCFLNWWRPLKIGLSWASLWGLKLTSLRALILIRTAIELACVKCWPTGCDLHLLVHGVTFAMALEVTLLNKSIWQIKLRRNTKVQSSKRAYTTKAHIAFIFSRLKTEYKVHVCIDAWVRRYYGPLSKRFQTFSIILFTLHELIWNTLIPLSMVSAFFSRLWQSVPMCFIYIFDCTMI